MKKEHGSFFGPLEASVGVCFVVIVLVKCFLLLLLSVLIDGILIAVVCTILDDPLIQEDGGCGGILVLECVVCTS